jgi:hypothetical protein
MLYRLAADIVLGVHFAFIVFVLLGGLIALLYRWAALLHLPTAAWGVFIEVSGRTCPLTTWENELRRRAGESGYSDSFIEHYILPLIYPAGLTREGQFWLAAIVIVVNVGIYAWLVHRHRAA